jgi:CRISPR-associated protein Cas6
LLDSVVDLCFPLAGGRPAGDTGYLFFAGVSAALGRHLPERVLVSRLSFAGSGPVGIGRVRFRLPATEIGSLVELAGKTVLVGKQELVFGVPQVWPLRPTDRLASHLVIIKPPGDRERPWFEGPDEFLTLAARSLERRGIAGTLRVPERQWGPHAGKPLRRVLTIKQVRIAGFAVEVSGLSPDGSLRLQAEGMGGRLHYGCGFFTPVVATRRTRFAP